MSPIVARGPTDYGGAEEVGLARALFVGSAGIGQGQVATTPGEGRSMQGLSRVMEEEGGRWKVVIWYRRQIGDVVRSSCATAIRMR